MKLFFDRWMLETDDGSAVFYPVWSSTPGYILDGSKRLAVRAFLVRTSFAFLAVLAFPYNALIDLSGLAAGGLIAATPLHFVVRIVAVAAFLLLTRHILFRHLKGCDVQDVSVRDQERGKLRDLQVAWLGTDLLTVSIGIGLATAVSEVLSDLLAKMVSA